MADHIGGEEVKSFNESSKLLPLVLTVRFCHFACACLSADIGVDIQ